MANELTPKSGMSVLSKRDGCVTPALWCHSTKMREPILHLPTSRFYYQGSSLADMTTSVLKSQAT